MRSYVYLHKDPITHEVRYVGAGSKGRAWACGWSSVGGPRRGNRTKEHQKWLDLLFDEGYTMADIVVILAQGLQAADARAVERKQILQYNVAQLFNIQTIPSLLSLNEKQIKKAKQLRMTGMSYKRIGKEIGSSTMTVYKLLNGKTKGYQIDVIAN